MSLANLGHLVAVVEDRSFDVIHAGCCEVETHGNLSRIDIDTRLKVAWQPIQGCIDPSGSPNSSGHALHFEHDLVVAIGQWDWPLEPPDATRDREC